MDIETQFEPAWEERKQTEKDERLECIPRVSANGEAMLLLQGDPFPSLPYWKFGLAAKKGVSEDQLIALAAKIEELCDGRVAQFDYQPEGLELYETDNYGLALVHEDSDSNRTGVPLPE